MMKLNSIKKMEEEAKKHYEANMHKGNPERQTTELLRAIYFQNQIMIEQNKIGIEQTETLIDLLLKNLSRKRN